MKHNLIFKHVAMSALLLSAIGAPVVANAETGQKSREIISSQVTKLDTVATTKMMSLNLNDPLELAKKYAPETVSDWESTLDKYKKLVTQGEFFAFDSKLVTSTAAVSLAKDIVAIPLNKSIVITPSVNDTPLVEGSARGAIEAENIEASIVVTASETTGDAVTIQATDISSVPSQLSSLIKAQIELAEAVESKDWIMIKSALNQLLKDYKEQIIELEASTADTDNAVPTVPIKK